MIASVPAMNREEIRRITRELAEKGHAVPEPQAVEVVATEDFEGDPVFVMTVTFSKTEKPENLPWKRISPLIESLRRQIFRAGHESRPVIAQVRRLGEKRPKT